MCAQPYPDPVVCQMRGSSNPIAPGTPERLQASSRASAQLTQAMALHRRGKLTEAERLYRAAVRHEPLRCEAVYFLGVIALQRGRCTEAVRWIDRALKLKPDHAEAWHNRSVALLRLRRLNDALESSDKALAMNPRQAVAWGNRGGILRELGRLDEALASCNRALTIKPDYAEGWNNRGIVLRDMKRLDVALASFEQASSIRPDYADAHVSAAHLRLLAGDFATGWKMHEWRWRHGSLLRARRYFPQPLWLGESVVAGKTILLHAEQGFGDTIQFCRYASLLAERGARVVIEAPRPLTALLSTLDGAASVVAQGDPLPAFDLHCPLLSLPLAFRTGLTDVPARVPYLQAPPERVEGWRPRLAAAGAPRIGLAWSGNPAHTNDRNRSIALDRLAPVFELGAGVVSLQKSIRPDERAWLGLRPNCLHLGDELRDFADTAALVSLLDVVISVDTSVAHLAGALAKPVWVLLPFLPDWRWLLDRDDSPWYPTARLFRQPAIGDWDGAIARLCAALRGLTTAEDHPVPLTL
jgi:tetratricopeptide (TPR) repeat protein